MNAKSVRHMALTGARKAPTATEVGGRQCWRDAGYGAHVGTVHPAMARVDLAAHKAGLKEVVYVDGLDRPTYLGSRPEAGE
jgi:hypothetical protein